MQPSTAMQLLTQLVIVQISMLLLAKGNTLPLALTPAKFHSTAVVVWQFIAMCGCAIVTVARGDRRTPSTISQSL
jgi:hypothetical protein